MSNSQMKDHKEDHKILKRTPDQYVLEAIFKALAKEKSHSRMVADETEEIKVLLAKTSSESAKQNHYLFISIST